MGWVFYGFRTMYVIAIAMFALASASLWLRWRGKLVLHGRIFQSFDSSIQTVRKPDAS